MVFKSNVRTVTIKGDKAVYSKLKLFRRTLQKGQFVSARKLLENARLESQRIIREKKAPVTTGNLENSLVISANKRGNEITHRLGTDVFYAKKVHSGYAPYTERNITTDLVNWFAANINPEAAKRIQARGWVRLGYPSKKGGRKYDAQVGMRFFDIPFIELRKITPKEYEKMVSNAILQSGLR